MIYPIKTLGQLTLILKGFRKEKGLTQAAVAEKLGITQQSYAYFEANPATATLERLFMVLRLMDVEISLDQTPFPASKDITPVVKMISSRRRPPVKAVAQKVGKASGTVAARKTEPNAKPSPAAKARRIVAPARKNEIW